ncbi:MAG: YsnF/AvaK domain-containing protein [Litorimonas sp.]
MFDWLKGERKSLDDLPEPTRRRSRSSRSRSRTPRPDPFAPPASGDQTLAEAQALNETEPTMEDTRKAAASPDAAIPDTDTANTATIVPLVEERLDVQTREVVGDTVRVDVQTHTDIRDIEEELRSESVDVRRIPIDQPVTERPAVRREGNTTIIPVVRERLVLKKELVLTEEIHITRERTSETVQQSVELRHQSATITRSKAN